VEARLLRHFGDNATYGAARLPVPRHILARVLDWQNLYLLNRAEPLALITEMERDCSQPRQLANLRALVTHGYGAALFRVVEEGKQRLSSAGHTVIELQREGIALREIITREEFEGIIREPHAAAERCVAEALSQAGLEAEAIGAVVTTGGSSRIPLFRRSLQQRFPNARLVEQDAFTSVAAGLALAGAAEAG